MKFTLNRLTYGFITLFVAAIAVSAYYLYNLPAILSDFAGVGQTISITIAETALMKVNALVFSVALLGLASLTLLMITTKKDESENVVYVEAYKNKDEEAVDEIVLDSESKYKNKVDGINQIIEQEGSEKMMMNRAMSKLCKDLGASHGAFYKAVYEEGQRYLELFASFAYSVPDSQKVRFEFGEGLAGQAAKEGRPLILNNVPDGYIKILSGLGAGSPKALIIMPLLVGEATIGVIEIASFIEFNTDEKEFIQLCASLLAKKITPGQNVIMSETVSENL